jgi:hypothetical protein
MNNNRKKQWIVVAGYLICLMFLGIRSLHLSNFNLFIIILFILTIIVLIGLIIVYKKEKIPETK